MFLFWFQESQNLVPLPSPVRHLRPRRPRSLYWKVFKEHRKGRSAQMSTSTVPKPFACKELPNTQGTLLQGLTNLITLPSSSILWPQSRPWRRLKTTTHLCSLSMWELTSPRSRHQWKSCTTLRLPKSTLWSGTCFFCWYIIWRVSISSNTHKLPWVTKTEFLPTILIQYQADKQGE